MSIFSNRADAAAEEAAGYINATLEFLGDKAPFEVLEVLADTLEEMAAENAEKLEIPEKPGKWSAKEVILHMADSELVWGWRLRLIIAHDKPQITGYDQDLWAKRLHYADEDLDLALQRIRVLRASNLQLIRSLTEEQLSRTGVHTERGKESVEHMIKLYAGHDLVHRRQIERILSNV